MIKVYSHKLIHVNSVFTALCSEVVFLHIQKNLLGHFSKMDKVKACPKIKNAHISFSNVFGGSHICGNIVIYGHIMLKYPLFSCIYTKIIQCSMSGSPFLPKTSIKIIQNIMSRFIYRALPEVNSSFLFGRCNCIALTIQLSKNETITRQ